MKDLLIGLEAGAAPGLLSITIDSHTRLRKFETAARTLRDCPANLNGYPLVAHGWRRGLELNEAVLAPLEIRHGSPDPRELFATAIAAGVISFEGGGVCYNLPYSKDVPLARSLEAWRQVDRSCGLLARDGIIVDRELFGTLTAVMVPPSISLAVTILEAVMAAEQGVRCISIAYPQNGEIIQDVAALRAVGPLARRYLPDDVEVFSVLHQFMGVFPLDAQAADELILLGGLVARLGGATKVITKTNQEAYGIPDTAANVHGLRTTALAFSALLDTMIVVDAERVEEEQHWLEREVTELVEPVLAQGERTGLATAVADAFSRGTLDIPFSASIHAHSAVIPQRGRNGAVRFLDSGRLPFSPEVLARNDGLSSRSPADFRTISSQIAADINYFRDRRAAIVSPQRYLGDEKSL
jgi:methylaspartate mutase epsilon subunit